MNRGILIAGMRIGSAGATLLGTMLLARTFPVSTTGSINSAIVIAQVMSLALTLGLNSSIIYFSRGKVRLLAAYLGFNYLVTIICWAIVSTIYVWLPIGETGGLPMLLQALSLALLSHITAYLQSSERFVAAGAVLLLQSCALMIATAISKLLQLTESVEFLGMYCGVSLAILLGCHVACSIFRVGVRAIDRKRKAYLGYGLNALTMNQASSIMYALDIVMMRSLGSSVALGIYTVSTSISRASWLIIDSLGAVIYSRVVNGTIGKEELKRLRWYSLLFVVFCFGGWLIMGKYILNATFGPRYADSYWLVLAMLAGSLLVVSFKFESRILAGLGRWRALNVAQVAAILSGLLLHLLLIPRFDLWGACIGSSISFAVCSAVMSYMSRSREGR